MPSCEKCWRDSRASEFCDGPTYADLIRERRDNPCTPEEQAGPDAGFCATCGRKTIHQICTGWCTACKAYRRRDADNDLRPTGTEDGR